jgi:hypothetical protein
MSAVLAGAGDIREVRMFGGRRFHDERQPGRCVLPSRTTTRCRKGSWGRSACPVRRRADVMRGWRKIALAVTNRDAGERDGKSQGINDGITIRQGQVQCARIECSSRTLISSSVSPLHCSDHASLHFS